LSFSNYSQCNLVVVNTGHTVEARFNNGFYTEGGPPFHSQEFHFHAAEEQIRDNGENATLHIVHSQIPSGATGKIAISIIGFLIKIGSHNHILQPFFDAFAQIQNPGDQTVVQFQGFGDIFDEITGTNTDGYWNFQGSLTTPPCSEPIDWNIMKEELFISIDQFNSLQNMLRKITNSTTNRTNERSIQRHLYNVSFRPGGPTPSRPWALVLGLTALLVVTILIPTIYWFRTGSKPVAYQNIQEQPTN